MTSAHTLQAALIADGSSDRIVIPLLRCLLAQHLGSRPFSLDDEPIKAQGNSLKERIDSTIQSYELDLLFVHRDSENQDWEARQREIDDAKIGAKRSVVGVVPVRMSEAWLLTSEQVIRNAVNPHSRSPLNLPTLKKIEQCDAKAVLLKALTEAADRKSVV